MINLENLNYGAIYSFEPEFMKHLTQEDNFSKPADEDSASYNLDMVDVEWSGILVILVYILIFGLIASFLR